MSGEKKPSVRAQLSELFKRVVNLVSNNETGIYQNGENNLYPNEIERVIANSPTAYRCSKIMAKYIGGAGVLKEDGVTLFKYNELPIVNHGKNYRITDIISLGSRSIANQGGVFFHVNYGIDKATGKLTQQVLDVLEYSRCRISEEDDEENRGKIYYKDYEKKKNTGVTKTDEKWFYPYNPDVDVVLKQIKKDAGKDVELEEAIKKYRGQVYYMNLTPEFIYAVPPIDCVYNEADSEYRIILYTNMQVRSGFLGKTAVLTQGLADDQAEKIKNDILEWLGAENSDSVFYMDLVKADDLEKVLKIIQLKGQYDEKMFSETNKRISRNIFGAFNNIPEALVMASDGAMFGAQSETYKEMKIFYSEQTEEERERLQETLAYLGFPVKIKPIAVREDVVSASIQPEEKTTEVIAVTTEENGKETVS